MARIAAYLGVFRQKPFKGWTEYSNAWFLAVGQGAMSGVDRCLIDPSGHSQLKIHSCPNCVYGWVLSGVIALVGRYFNGERSAISRAVQWVENDPPD